eukprot:5431857-Pleurochrysis_carterae.AAC.4
MALAVCARACAWVGARRCRRRRRFSPPRSASRCCSRASIAARAVRVAPTPSHLLFLPLPCSARSLSRALRNGHFDSPGWDTAEARELLNLSSADVAASV